MFVYFRKLRTRPSQNPIFATVADHGDAVRILFICLAEDLAAVSARSAIPALDQATGYGRYADGILICCNARGF